ncbi:hypothetical protein HXX76_004055 [Chlamydomonas incerta]|uniref:Uncharacterized protein n=1 Tax=Chlamydomonas incerta TaxID=51695 RepID=A0A835T9H5_CHLIN|nr:hypothetical protein HXX76_004055 [Chlamydomonas incerta]|eukprot:KAG2439936.1 hypothetical protein HXX76_004055 [Chlamydomonas incerta]
MSTQLRSACWGPQVVHPSLTGRAWPFPSLLHLRPAAFAAASTPPSTRANVPALGVSSHACITPGASASGRFARDISAAAAVPADGGSASGRDRPGNRERTGAAASRGAKQGLGSSASSGVGGRAAGSGGRGKAPSKDGGAGRGSDRSSAGSSRPGGLAGGGQRAPRVPAPAGGVPHTAGPGAGSGTAAGSAPPPAPSPPPPPPAAPQPVSGSQARSQPPPQQLLPPALGALLRVVGPLEDAGWAYCAVRRTAAWLQGAPVPLGGPVTPVPRQPDSTQVNEAAAASAPESSSWPQGLQHQAAAAGGEADVVLELELQWDQMAAAHDLFSRPGSGWTASPLQQQPALGRASFSLLQLPAGGQAQPPPAGARGPAAAAAVAVVVGCTYNTVLRANPARVQVAAAPPELQQAQQQKVAGGGSSMRPRGLLQVLVGPEAGGAAGERQQPLVWVQSMYAVGVEAERDGDTGLAAAVADTLRRMQKELSAHNSAAWGRDTAFDAWCARFGPPEEAAARLVRDPGRCLGPLLPYLLQLPLQLPRSAAPHPTAHLPPAAAAHPAHPAAPQQLQQLPLRGLTAANLCGSHGHKAVALAALGAGHVTVLDVSAGNAAYATRLAAAAGLRVAGEAGTGGGSAADAAAGGGIDGGTGDGVQFRYLLADLAECRPPGQAAGGGGTGTDACCGLYDRQYDVVLMELGVLHYFLDLRALMRDTVAPLLRPGGRLLLREFHPVSTKLLTSRGRKHKVTGDYFASQPLAPVDVAYSKYEEAAAAGAAAAGATAGAVGAEEGDGGSGGREGAGVGAGGGGSRARVLLRRWGLGEVVSAVCAGSGGRLALVALDEEAGARLDDCGLPKLFTLVAERTQLP